MADQDTLPKGYTLDSLPQGYTLDAAPAAEDILNAATKKLYTTPEGIPVYERPAWREPEGSAVVRGAKGLWRTAGGGILDMLRMTGGAMTGLPTPGSPSFEAMTHLVMGHIDQAEKAKAALQAGRHAEAFGHSLATILPFLGPAAAGAAEKFGSDEVPQYDRYGNVVRQGQAPDIAGGVGETIGLLGMTTAHPTLEAYRNVEGAYQAGRAMGGLPPRPLIPRPGFIPRLPSLKRPLFESKLNEVEQQAIDTLRARDIPLRAGVLTGNRYLKAVEGAVEHTPLGSQRAAEFRKGTEEGLQQFGQELMGEAFPTPETPESAGTAAREGLQRKIEGFQEEANQAYEQAWKGRGKKEHSETVPLGVAEDGSIIEGEVNMPVDVRDLKDAAQPIRDELDMSLSRSEQAQSKAYNALEKLLGGNDYVPAWMAERALSALKSLARTANKTGVRDYSQGVAAGLVPRLQAEIDAAVAKTGQDAIDGLKAGRAAHANMMDVMDVAEKLSEEPVQAFGQMTWAHDSGIGRLRRIAYDAPDAMPRLGRAFVQQLFDKATREGGIARTKETLNRWRDLGPQTKELLFPDPALRAKLDGFFKSLDMVVETTNPSGTEFTRQATSFNPVRWVGGLLGGRVLFTPRGISLLTEALRTPEGSAKASLIKKELSQIQGSSDYPPVVDVSGEYPVPPEKSQARQLLERLWSEEEGSVKLPGAYGEHQPPPEGEPVSPLKPLVPEVRRGASGKLEGSLHNLRRAAEREPGVGGPDNERTVLSDDKGEFVVGKVTPEDWVNRVGANLTPDEMVKARRWYRELQGFFVQHFGKEEGPRMALAWLSSQQNMSPSGGMMNVLRAMDQLRGLPAEKTAGLAEKKILAALKDEMPEGGYGAKLNDFVDSALGKTTRTWMGDDPRGGQPAVIDVWANRDVGKIDDKLYTYLVDRFGEDAVKHLKQDGVSIGETDYEYGSKFYNNLVQQLNKTKFDGGGWTGEQVQAVGWVAMQKAMGALPEFASDLISKNSRGYSWEVQPGEGSPVLRQYPWHTLSTDQQANITEYVGTRVTDLAAKLTGAKILNREISRGAYLGQPTINIQMDVFGSPEAFQDFSRVSGYLGQQSEVWHVRPLASGKSWAYFIRSQKGLDTPQLQQEFWTRLRDKVGANLVPGYTPITDADGSGVMIVNPFSEQYLFERRKAGFKNPTTMRYWTAKDKATIDAGINAVEKEMGLDIYYDFDKVDLGASMHNWARKGKTNGHIQGLVKTGRSALAESLPDNASESLQSWWKEAWDQFGGGAPTGTSGATGPAAQEINPAKKAFERRKAGRRSP